MRARAAGGSSQPSSPPPSRRTPEAASVQWRAVADQIRPRVPKLAALLDAAEEDVLAYMTFPKEPRAKLHQVLNRLVETWNQSRTGGEFTVVDAGSGFHLVPTSRRGVGGAREPYTPPLSARIDLAWEQRSGLDTLTEIARLVSAQTGRPIQLHPSLSYQVLCGVGEERPCAINVHAIRQD